MQTCSTIECRNVATTCLAYSFPESRGILEHDHVCDDCAASYLARPTLQATVTGKR